MNGILGLLLAMSVIPSGPRVDLSWQAATGATYVVDPHLPFQTMDGFGASDPFLDTTTLTTAQADQYFGTGAGSIGLSWLLIGIDTDGSNMGNWDTAAKAVARGAKLVAAPWSAAAVQKDNNDINNGGHLLVASYGDWSDKMVAYDALAVTNTGVHLSAISIQTEPDFTNPSSVSMRYTNAELVNYLKVIGPKVRALNQGIKIVLPEVADVATLAGFVNAVLADATAVQYLDIVAWHQYGGNNTSPVAGYPNWMTEMSYFNTFDATMSNALVMTQDMHAAITTGNCTAWIWWWILRTARADNEGLTDTTQETKRLWAMGNYSKFIRPGHIRVSSTGSVSGVFVTAYKDPARAGFVIVAINANAGSQAVTMGVKYLTASAVTPWITDASNNLASQATLPLVNGQFSTTLTGASVTTFVSVP